MYELTQTISLSVFPPVPRPPPRSHNPGIFIKVALSSKQEFALYDYESPAAVAGQGWQLASAAQLEMAKGALVAQYNAEGGLPVVKPFKSGNCCLATKGGAHLIMSKTPWGYIFPNMNSSIT